MATTDRVNRAFIGSAGAQTLTPYLLVGGRSTRMGTDKAFVRLHGKTLLEHALERLRTLGPPVLLSGDAANTSRQRQLSQYGRIVPDRTPNAGPLGGIDAALQDATTDWLLILPIDQPNFPASALPAWVDGVMASDAVASWWSQTTGPEPLPLLLHRQLAPSVAEAVVAGERKLLSTIRRMAGARLVEIPSEEPAWFHNLNTVADIERLRGLPCSGGRD